MIYDSKEPSFRKERYAEYKANRSAPPDDLIPQFDRIEQLVTAFKMHSFRKSGVEADDLIATLTQRWLADSPKHQVVIVYNFGSIVFLTFQLNGKNVYYSPSPNSSKPLAYKSPAKTIL